jgi:hypothetical protein
VIVHSRDGRVERAINEVLSVIPEAVAKFALTRCTFVVLGRTCSGFSLAPRPNRWLVVVGDFVDEWDIHSIVAHEIAHAWLRHDGRGDTVGDEQAACKLVMAWGISGSGADPGLNSRHAAYREDLAASAGPMASIHFEDDQVRLQCGYCKHDAELFSPALRKGQPHLVARCPPERCDWVFSFRLGPGLVCPECEALVSASWLRAWWWPHLELGRVDRVLGVLAGDVARWLGGKGWPRRPPIIYLRCGVCRWRGMAFVRLANRRSMLSSRAEPTSPDLSFG